MAATTPSERIPNRSRSQPSSTYIAPRSQGSSPVPNPNLAQLPPLNTSQRSRRPSSQRVPSATSKRISTLSNTSAQRSRSRSRPQSTVIPQFQSSLTYALVRDFAYPPQHHMHYGPPSQSSSAVTTPAIETQRRLSDPSLAFPTSDVRPGHLDLGGAQLPATTYADGPPWPEEEDLHSPIVTSAKKNRELRSDFELDPEDEDAGHGGRRQTSDDDDDSEDITPNGREHIVHKARRQQSKVPTEDSYFGPGAATDSPHEPDEDSRYSRDYSFTIASPDEEMHGKAVALYDFAKENENELPLIEGQVLWVSYRHIEGWLVAQDPKSGESGLVPEAYIRLLRDIEGGLGGLNGLDAAMAAEGVDTTTEDVDTNSPSKVEPPEPPEPPLHDSRRPSTQPKSHGPYTPVVSHFSTSSNDLQPYPQRLLSVSSQSGVSSPQASARRTSEEMRIEEQDEPDSTEEDTSEEEGPAELKIKQVPEPARKGSVKR